MAEIIRKPNLYFPTYEEGRKLGLSSVHMNLCDSFIPGETQFDVLVTVHTLDGTLIESVNVGGPYCTGHSYVELTPLKAMAKGVRVEERICGDNLVNCPVVVVKFKGNEVHVRATAAAPHYIGPKNQATTTVGISRTRYTAMSLMDIPYVSKAGMRREFLVLPKRYYDLLVPVTNENVFTL